MRATTTGHAYAARYTIDHLDLSPNTQEHFLRDVRVGHMVYIESGSQSKMKKVWWSLWEVFAWNRFKVASFKVFKEAGSIQPSQSAVEAYSFCTAPEMLTLNADGRGALP